MFRWRLRSLKRMRSTMKLEPGQKKVEESEIGLTRVATTPQWRGPISPRAINTNNRHISPPPNLDE